MIFLFDENISYRIVRKISEDFPGSKHVTDIRPPLQSDFSIFSYARQNSFTIVTFDQDFYDLQLIHGFPPKVVWLRTGNTSTLNVLHKIIAKKEEIITLMTNSDIGMLEIY